MFSLSKYFLKPKAWIAPGLLAVLVLMGPVASFAQSDRDVQNRLNRMENEIQTLSRAIYKGEKPPAGSFSGGASGADVEVRLQQIEIEMRDVRGLVEQQSYEIRQLKNQLERVTGDLELRVGDLEGRGGSVSGGAASGAGASRYTAGSSSASRGSSVQSAPSAVPGYQWGTNNAEDGGSASSSDSRAASQRLGSYNSSGASDVASATYDNAFSMVKNRQYKAAQSEFEVFLRDHPEHALAGNAKYWLGETHYVRGNFETAARIFAEGYQSYPTGSKAGDNLLKLGLSLDALGKREDACVALKQLKKENPAGGAPVTRRADQEMSRLGC